MLLKRKIILEKKQNKRKVLQSFWDLSKSLYRTFRCCCCCCCRCCCCCCCWWWWWCSGIVTLLKKIYILLTVTARNLYKSVLEFYRVVSLSFLGTQRCFMNYELNIRAVVGTQLLTTKQHKEGRKNHTHIHRF